MGRTHRYDPAAEEQTEGKRLAQEASSLKKVAQDLEWKCDEGCLSESGKSCRWERAWAPYKNTLPAFRPMIRVTGSCGCLCHDTV